jgi:hypothetical protein
MDNRFEPVTGGAFTAQVQAPEGAMTLRATATDAAGNTSIAEVGATIDPIAPAFTLTSPPDQLITNLPSVPVSGSVADASPIVLTVNGAEVPLSGGAFTTNVTPVERLQPYISANSGDIILLANGRDRYQIGDPSADSTEASRMPTPSFRSRLRSPERRRGATPPSSRL